MRFQADLDGKDATTVLSLKKTLGTKSNADLLREALGITKWVLSEWRRGRRVASLGEDNTTFVLVSPLEDRVAPEQELPRVEIDWTAEELASLASMMTEEPASPTPGLVRVMKRQ